MYWDGSQWRADMVRSTSASEPPVVAGPAGSPPVTTPKKPWYTRKRIMIPLAVVAGIVVISGIGSALGGDEDELAATPSVEQTEDSTQIVEEAPEPVMVAVPNVVGLDGATARTTLEAIGLEASFDGDGTMPVVAQDVAEGAEVEKGSTVILTLEEKPQLTLGQENAIRQAESYLKFSSFSRQGLYDQMTSEYGSGFESADAEFAIAYLEQNGLVDWNAEAVEAAESYLEVSSFSRQGLFDQLTSEYGSGFTPTEAEHALGAVGY